MIPADLPVVHEDNHLLAVIKPAGLLVQGDRSGHVTLLDLARRYLKRKYRKPGNVYLGLVHRLDRPVSGLVLLARTSKAARRLAEQFRAGTLAKTYLAVVLGRPARRQAELVSYLATRGDRQGRTRAGSAPFPGAREAKLFYRVRERRRGCTLLEVEPRTGRRHQIRAQLALLGHPILGDLKYGAPGRLPGRRIGLHALRLVVAHPVGGERLVLEAPPPVDGPWPPPRPAAGERSTG